MWEERESRKDSKRHGYVDSNIAQSPDNVNRIIHFVAQYVAYGFVSAEAALGLLTYL